MKHSRETFFSPVADGWPVLLHYCTHSHYYRMIDSQTQYKNVEQCFAVNFGSTTPFDIPTLSVDIKKDFQNPNDISTNHCFLVFVGGKYVDVIEEVMKKVDTIAKDIALTPLAVFVTTNEKIQKDLPVTAKIPMVK